MSTLLTAAPIVEPVSLAEVKAHLRLETSDEDGLLQSLILTSRLHVEVALGLALITQGWSCFFDTWPSSRGSAGALSMPIFPIRSIDSIKLYDEDGTFAVVSLANVTLYLASRPARIMARKDTQPLRPGRSANGIEVSVTAGFGPAPSNVPAPIRHALLQLITHWYEHRDPGEVGTDQAHVPNSVSRLLAPWAPIRL